jgi:hypothetical protein
MRGSSPRHCERSEAIHVSASCAMDCFAPLAMTMWRQRGRTYVMSCVTARRANHQKPVQSLARKYSAFVLTQITGITPPVSPQMRGARERHERAVRCDGRGRRDRRARFKRTAKSCGSGVAVPALRSGEARLLWNNGGKRAVLRGEHEVSRKAIAQGRPECSRCPVCSCAALAMRKQHARPRVQQAPGLPCALCFRARSIRQPSGAMRREIAKSYSIVVTREGA